MEGKMGHVWLDREIVCCDAETLINTLPKGLKGRFDEGQLNQEKTILIVKVPQPPHKLYAEYCEWLEMQGLLEWSE